MKSLTIFCNAALPPEELDRLGGFIESKGAKLLHAGDGGSSNLVEGPGDPALLQADIAFGQPRYEDALQSPRLKWIQITSAGYARYDKPEFRAALRAREGVFCNASSVYAEPCAEHAVALMLSGARQLPLAIADQLGGKTWPAKEIRQESRLLTGQSVLLVGYGAIAARMVELLGPYRMHIKALRRQVRGDEAVKTYPIIALDELLSDADHVVNILPGTPETENLFDARRIGAMKKGAMFYNIGRGTTVDPYALWTALQTGHLRGACLDVTNPEPLHAESPLWSAPRCVITPHTAGGFDGEFTALVNHFTQNLDRYLRGDALSDRVF